MSRIYVDMDGVIANYAKAFYADTVNKFPQSKPGFFRDLEPIGLNHLIQLGKYHDVYILTAPSVCNPLSYTEKAEWITKHLGRDWLRYTIIAYDKSLLIGDYLIDDNIEGRGQEDFQGELIHFGSDEYPDWECILDIFT